MTVPRWREVEAAVAPRFEAAEQVFCCLDFDGTLAPLAATPNAVATWPGTAQVLAQLADAPGTQLALISGRTIADLRRFLDLSNVYYVGVHGLEIEFPDGTLSTAAAAGAARAVLPAIKQRLHNRLSGRPGILIEDKGLALACHYRLASRADAATARAAVAALMEECQLRNLGVSMIQGHEVVEIRPASVNKGTVVRTLLALTPTALTVYVGDDQTDEEAFALLPADAITVRVGSASVSTSARYRVEDPAEVHQFLRTLLACRTGRGLGGGSGPV